MAKTMFEKIWNSHLVHEQDGNSIIYIDRHLVHEVTSPQAFEGLRLAGRRVLHPEATFAVRLLFRSIISVYLGINLFSVETSNSAISLAP